MISRPLVACIVIALAARAEAQRAEADVEFQRGRTLIARGQIAEACAAFEASMKLDAEPGTLYNLALCHEKLGKLATAWSEFDELSRTDTNEARIKDERRSAAALLPRLPRMRLVAPEGVTVTRDHVDVTPLIGKSVPVDPGHYTFEATADGREPFTLEVDFAEAKEVQVEVPALRRHHHHEDAEPSEPTGYPIELPRRPILIPQGTVEVTVEPSVSTSVNFDRTAIDAGAFARGRIGPIEVSALVGFIIRSPVIMDKPNQWDTVGVGVRYPIDPAFVLGVTYVEDQPVRADLRGSDFGANVERKLLLYPKVAVDGRAGFLFSQRENAGDALVLVGEGRAQFSVAGPFSLEGFAGLGLNVGGMLYDYTVGLDVAALALYVITPRLDAFVQVASGLLPDSSLHTYTVGASWRSR